MDPAAKLEQVVRLQAVLLAHERGDRAAVCEEGEAYLALPDVHLDLVTARPNVHAVVGRAYDVLEWPGSACDHYHRALLGQAHLHLVDPVDLRLHAVLARLKTGRYAGIDDLLDAVLTGAGPGPAQRSLALRLAAIRTWRTGGDLAEAGALLERAAEAAGQVQGGLWWHDGVYRGQFLLESGRDGEARAVLDLAVDEQRARLAAGHDDLGHRLDLAMALGAAALAAVRHDDPATGAGLLAEAAGLLDRGRTYALVHHLLVETEVLAATEGPASAEATWAAAVELVEERELRPTAIQAWEARARTADDPDERRRALDRARALAEELGHVADARRLASLVERLG